MKKSHRETINKIKNNRIYICGVPIDPMSDDEIIELFDVCCKENIKSQVLCNLNLHGLYCALTNSTMLDLLQKKDTIIQIDGRPIEWIAKIIQKEIFSGSDKRNAHIDLIPKIFKFCSKNNLSILILNGDKKSSEENKNSFQKIFPGLKIFTLPAIIKINNGVLDNEAKKLADQVNEINPDLLLVGMGMPKQEIWINTYKNYVSCRMIMPVGGFADYFSGRTKTPPRWLGNFGLEWLYRLIFSPRRLAFRYLLEPIILIMKIIFITLNGAKWGKKNEE